MATAPQQIIDKNGKHTTVHRSVDGKPGTSRSSLPTPKAAKESVTALHRRLSDDDDASISAIRSELRDFSTPEGATYFCEGGSMMLQEMIGGEMLRLTGMVSEPSRNPGDSNLAAIEHHVLVKNGYVYDITARQFEPSADFPQILAVEEFLSKWNTVEMFDREEDDWIDYEDPELDD